MRVCVYCGSSPGNRPAFVDAARDLGARLADRGIGLVYGGGNVGLMGTVAEAVLAAGGTATGVIPDFLMRAEIAHMGLSSLEIVESMHARKARMAELAVGFIALPGGFGTLEELAEMVTWTQLALQAKPIVLLDVEGFWAPLVAWRDAAAAAGFVRPEHRRLLQLATSPDTAIDLATAVSPPTPGKWLDRDRT